MISLHPDTVAIRALRLRHAGGADRARGAEDSARLRQDLAWADWPEAPGESWVFIRRLAARGPVNGLALQLARQARDAVAGGSGDNVVRFAGLTELLAALLTDLVRGVAADRWYWRRFSGLFTLPLPRAMASLLAEQVAFLPAVCARLGEDGALAPVWLALDETGARDLFSALAVRNGLRPDALEKAIGKGWEDGDATVPPAGMTPVNTTVRHRWAPFVDRLPARDARLRLALLLIGQEVAPLLLQREPETLVRRLRETFGGFIPEPGVRGGGRSEPAEEQAPEHAGGPAGALHRGFRVTRLEETDSSAFPPPETGPHQASPPAASAEGEPAPGLRGIPEPGGPAVVGSPSQKISRCSDGAAGESHSAAIFSRFDGQAPLQPAPSVPARSVRDLLSPREKAESAFHSFHTRQGGLFYLLNILNRGEAQDIMREHWAALPNGWGWLYRLGGELLPDNEDPVAAFLAAQMGLEYQGLLAELPSLPARDALLGLVRRWYGRTGLWRPELLALAARVHASPSHVDLYAPLSTVRLDVRLAGLDINPGWLPWLGRVVLFHYG